MSALGFIAVVLICLGAGGFFKDLNFAEFGMPKTGRRETMYLEQYKYIKEKGELSTILSLCLGSFGMIPLSLIMAVIFFFLNTVLYLGLMTGAFHEYGKFHFIPVFIAVRIFNAIVVYSFTKLRLKLIEKDLLNFLYGGKFKSLYVESVKGMDIDERTRKEYIEEIPKKRKDIEMRLNELKSKSFV